MTQDTHNQEERSEGPWYSIVPPFWHCKYFVLW